MPSVFLLWVIIGAVLAVAELSLIAELSLGNYNTMPAAIRAFLVDV